MRRERAVTLLAIVWGWLAALACSRIDDSDCLATRTCDVGSAGQAGAGGAPLDDDTSATGRELAGSPQ